MNDPDTPAPSRRLSFAWDSNTALAMWVLGALALLWLIGRGFRGININLGA